MATKDVSAGNTGAKKPRGKPFPKGNKPVNAFTGKDDPRANQHGQRNKEVVATAAQARDLYVTVLHEPINTPPQPGMSNLEYIVRKHVIKAKEGDKDARETMFDRIWGKSTQMIEADIRAKMEVSASDLSDEQLAAIAAGVSDRASEAA